MISQQIGEQMGEQIAETVRESAYTYNLAEVIRQRAWVEIDLDALRHNVRQLKALLAPRTQLMAVVKADAYGHGAIRVAQTALQEGATWLAIATLGEGIELREAGIIAPILVLGAVNTPQEIRAIAHWKLQPTLCSLEQGQLFADTMQQLGKTLPVHLKLDTGMSRLGSPWQEALTFVQGVQQLPQLTIASLYSHLATADDPNPTAMLSQQQRFESAIAQLKQHQIPIPPLHFANSAATLASPTLHYDWVRVGLALYGLYPAPHLAHRIHLKSVLQVKARVTQVKTIPPGTGVSYGHHFVSDRTMPIAVVGIGYADGIPRNLSNRLKVLIRGQEIPQIGAITMDQIMLDISQIPDLAVGEVVTIIGQDGDRKISADDWAQQLGTISWEILCSFKHRLPRVSLSS
jgi:alanine racemase